MPSILAEMSFVSILTTQKVKTNEYRQRIAASLSKVFSIRKKTA